jgi:hypothetical protein
MRSTRCIATAVAILRTYLIEDRGDLILAIGDYHSHSRQLNLTYQSEFMQDARERRTDNATMSIVSWIRTTISEMLNSFANASVLEFENIHVSFLLVSGSGRFIDETLETLLEASA